MPSSQRDIGSYAPCAHIMLNNQTWSMATVYTPTKKNTSNRSKTLDLWCKKKASSDPEATLEEAYHPLDMKM